MKVEGNVCTAPN